MYIFANSYCPKYVDLKHKKKDVTQHHMKRQLLRNQTIIVDVTSPILEHTINIPGDVHGFSQKSIRNGSKLYTNRYTNICIYIYTNIFR